MKQSTKLSKNQFSEKKGLTGYVTKDWYLTWTCGSLALDNVQIWKKRMSKDDIKVNFFLDTK